MLPRVTCCALIVLSSAMCLTAQSPTSLGGGPAFEAADALIRSTDPTPRPVPLDLDVSVAIWAPTALWPSPFLRLTHAPGTELTGDLYVWWRPPADIEPSKLPRDPKCRPPSEGAPVCIAKVAVSERIDWGALFVDIVAARVCSMTLTSGDFGMMFDAGDLDVRIYSAGTSDTYWCNAPRNSFRAGAREAARVMDVLEKLTSGMRSGL
jgi:hypothetical protein